MPKRTSKILLLILTVAIVALFGVGEIMAQAACDPPTNCINNAGWKVELVGGAPVLVDSGTYKGLWEWTYMVVNTLTGDSKGLNHINFTIPVCCPDEVVLTQGDNATLAWYPAPEGDPTTNFGKYLYEVNVAKFTPQNSTNYTWSFYSNSGKIAGITAALKIGKTFSSCFIAGPGCPGLAQMAVGTEQFVTTEDGHKFKIIEDPYTQCILKVFELLADGTQRELTKGEARDSLQTTDENPEPLVFLGVPGQGCPRAIVKAEGESTWYFISGRYVWR